MPLLGTAQAQLTEQGSELMRVTVSEVLLCGVSGCLDCAQEDLAWIELTGPDGSLRATYLPGAPPEELQPIDSLVTQLIESLSTCEDSEYVTIDPGCTPLPDP